MDKHKLKSDEKELIKSEKPLLEIKYHNMFEVSPDSIGKFMYWFILFCGILLLISTFFINNYFNQLESKSVEVWESLNLYVYKNALIAVFLITGLVTAVGMPLYSLRFIKKMNKLTFYNQGVVTSRFGHLFRAGFYIKNKLLKYSDIGSVSYSKGELKIFEINNDNNTSYSDYTLYRDITDEEFNLINSVFSSKQIPINIE